MTTDLGDWRPRPDRVRHSYRCPRRAPLLDAVRTLDDGREVEVSVCSTCGGTDMAERLLDRSINSPTQKGSDRNADRQ